MYVFIILIIYYVLQCIFVDSSNSFIFITSNNGETIRKVGLPFHPSEISFYEADPSIVIALDKVDATRKVRFSIFNSTYCLCVIIVSMFSCFTSVMVFNGYRIHMEASVPICESILLVPYI